MSAVHPRHGFWYKVGFVFSVILVGSLVAFAVIAVAGIHVQQSTAVFLGNALISSFFLAVVSFLIDSIRFKRTGWILVDGILTLVAIYLIIRYGR